MKHGWEKKELGAVSAINYGYTESASSEPIGPRFLRITDIQNDQVNWDSVPYCKINSPDLPKFRLATGDIVFARTGATTGKSFLVAEPPESVFASYLIRLRVHENNLLPEFVSLFFQTAGYWKSIQEGVAGSAQGGFNASKLAALKIPIPPITDQQRIVGIINEAFDDIAAAKANAEKNLQNARALFDSHLQSVFADAWETGELASLADLATDITDGDHMPPPKASSGVPFVTIGNVTKDTRTIDFSDTFMVSRDYFDRLKYHKKPMKGDVLYTVTGSFGIPVLISEHREFCFQRHIGLVRPKQEVSSEWLYYLLMSPQVLSQANDGATGTAQKTVSLKVLRGFQVPRVPLVIQQATAVRLNAVSEETQRLEAIYQQKLAALDQLKKSLLHQAFTGSL